MLVADTAMPNRQAWGQPVATQSGIGEGSTTFDLNGRTGGAMLLWITDLGQGNSSVGIAELRLA